MFHKLLTSAFSVQCAAHAPALPVQVTCVWSEHDWFPHKHHQYGVHEAGGGLCVPHGAASCGICARNLCRPVWSAWAQSSSSALCRASTCKHRACTSTCTACLAEEAWLLRYLFVSRAVWQGYNVLLLDTDSWLYRDPYLYLTRPPFQNIRWIWAAGCAFEGRRK